MLAALIVLCIIVGPCIVVRHSEADLQCTNLIARHVPLLPTNSMDVTSLIFRWHCDIAQDVCYKRYN